MQGYDHRGVPKRLARFKKVTNEAVDENYDKEQEYYHEKHEKALRKQRGEAKLMEEDDGKDEEVQHREWDGLKEWKEIASTIDPNALHDDKSPRKLRSARQKRQLNYADLNNGSPPRKKRRKEE